MHHVPDSFFLFSMFCTPVNNEPCGPSSMTRFGEISPPWQNFTVFGRNWGLYVTRCWEKMAQFPQMLPYTIVWKNTVIDYQISGLYLLVRKFVIHPIWSHCSCVGSAVKNISCSLRRFEANWQDLNLRHWNKTRIKITFGPCQGKCI